MVRTKIIVTCKYANIFIILFEKIEYEIRNAIFDNK